MSGPSGAVDIRHLTQKATAAAKNYRVTLGWKPDFVFIVNWGAANSLLLLKPGDDTGSSAVQWAANVTAETTAITINSDGYTLGQNDAIKADAGEIYVIALRGAYGIRSFDLDDVEAYESREIGTGKQFNVPDEDAEGDWVGEV